MTPSRTWLFVGGLLLTGWLIFLLKPILTPFLVAALLAYLGDPIADRLQARGLNRTLAVTLVFALLTLALLLLLLLLIPMLGRQVSYLAAQVPAALQWIEQIMLPWIQQRLGLDVTALEIGELSRQLAEHWQQAGGVVKLVLAQTATSGIALLAWLANLALVPVVAFYLLRDWDLMLARIHASLPRSIAPTTAALARECDSVLAAFLRGQLLVMLALGTIYSLGLWAIGLKLALLIGIVAGLANIVPYLGFIVGVGAATLAAFFQFHDWTVIGLVWGVFIIGQALEGTVLTPLLVGDRIGLHPVAVIFAVLAGGQLFGFVGILLALPIAAVVMVLFRHAHRRYLGSTLYEDAPAP